MDDWVTCDRCWGEGTIVTCCDDLCVGSGHCIHGDGEHVCPDCNGDGEIYVGEDWGDPEPGYEGIEDPGSIKLDETPAS